VISISPHTHPESQLTGSTVAAMVKRAAELKRTHFSYTDLGHLSSALKAYGLSKKAGLKFAAGIEFYFKDPKCNLVTGTPADRCRYFNGTLFAKNQAAYQELVRVVSKDDMLKIVVQDEEQSLWSWDELERLSKFDTLLVLGGIHCMVGKTFLADGPELAENVLLKAKSLFGDRLSLALICEPWNKKYATVIKIDYADASSDSLLASDTVTTDKARKIKASDLITRSGHTEIESKIVGSTFFKVGKKILKITEHKGFLPLPVDATLEINKFFIEMSKKHEIPALVSDYAFYAEKEDHIVQTMVLEGTNKLKSSLHMKTEQEMESYLVGAMGLYPDHVGRILENNNIWAKNFDNFELKYEWRLADSGGNALQQCMEVIKKNGRMNWKDPVYTSRLREEIQVIAQNGIKDFSAYFLPIADVVTHYRENGKLTGPSRGSAGGSLFCYVMGITQVDPIRYGLSFPRFLSLDRIKNGDIPDVDTDFPDRDLLIGKDGKTGYLYQRWGNKAAQISTRHKVRLKSAVKDTNRYLNGAVEKEVEAFSKALPEPPQGVPDQDFVFGYEDTDGNHISGLFEQFAPLREYAAKRPKEWEIVQKALGITRAHSLHASAFVLSDIPISDILPTKEGNVTQYEAKQCEAAGLVKYDFLTVSNIKDIETCLKIINKKNGESPTIGYFTHKGKQEYVWDLPTDPDAFKSSWDGNTETLFQINTKSMIPFVKEILPESVDDLSVILALVRPGPMDYIDEVTGRSMAEEYVLRRQGKSQPDLVELFDLIKETYGIIVFQEQSLRISKELGGMLPSDAEKLRRLFSKKLKKEAGEMKPIFMSTAVKLIGEEKANKIWDMMETSSRYSFNLSHSIGYGLITYAGMFLRHNYQLEWWAAVLTNAKEKEISGKLWPHVKDLVAPPDINLSTDQMEIDYANHKIRAKLGVIRGMGTTTIDPIVAGRPYKDIQDFVDRDVAGPSLSRKLIHVGVLDSLFPPKSELLQKLQMFEDAVEKRKFIIKRESLSVEKQENMKIKEPKKGVIPEEYLNVEKDPMKNAAIKKSILPSLLVGLYDLGKNHSKCIIGLARPSRNVVSPGKDKLKPLLVSGEMLQRLNETPGESLDKDQVVAATGFVVSTEIFDYKKNTKQALKVTLDCDGHVQEYVQWPDYYTQELDYPKELKKGNICTVFLKKRAGEKEAKPCSILEIVIEA
jgi:DNA-directed DNA polymerase III PolC